MEKTKKKIKKPVVSDITADLKEIKRWLGKGGIKQLAEEKGVNVRYAYHILAGRSKNFEFLAAARERAIEEKARQANGMARLRALDEV